MAKVYGCPESEKEIFELCPYTIENLDGINNIHQELIDQLKYEEKDFFDNLPMKVNKQENILEKIRTNKRVKIQKFDNKISAIRAKIKTNKKDKQWFSIILNFSKIFTTEYIFKPLELIKITISEQKQKKILLEWKENPRTIFNREHFELMEDIEELNELKKNPFYSGAIGERKVLDELLKLNDEYTILCGVNLELYNWVMSNDKKSKLKSAQIDFIVVSYKGIFLIEVKNWSDNYCKQNIDFSPHEQVDRAGKVLYLFLESNLKYDVPIPNRITKIIIPINDNIRYNPTYKWVMVVSLGEINHFVDRGRGVFTDREVLEIIDVLEQFTTQM